MNAIQGGISEWDIVWIELQHREVVGSVTVVEVMVTYVNL
jgi:hypothetical protein